MRERSKHTILLAGLALLLSLAVSAGGPDYAFGGGGPGIGLLMPDLEGINAFVTGLGFAPFGDSLFLVGGEGRGGLMPGFAAGGAGWGAWVESEKGSLHAEYGLGLGGFDLGYALGGDESSVLSVGAVIGGGIAELILTEHPPVAPFGVGAQGLVIEPAEQIYDSFFAFTAPYVDVQIQLIDWIGLAVRAGYLWSPIELNWQDDGLLDPPGLAPSGPYVRLSIRFGGIGSLVLVPLADRLQGVLDKAVGSRKSSYTGAVLYVDHPATGVWAGAAGLADVATEEPMAANSQFGIGSIAKPFVATVVLQLMEEGSIDLDTLIGTYLPEDLVARVSFGDQITVRMLLNHTSGIAEWLTEDVIAQIAEDLSIVWDVERLLDIAREQEPFFLPGAGLAYSNTDYTLLGAIIEAVTGNWWGDEVRTRILDPIGLNDTVVRAPGDASIPVGMARGYAAMGGEFLDLTPVDPSMAGAAGGNAMVSTTSDLARFLDALLAGELFASEETLAEMLDFVDAPDDLGYPYWYGLGLEKRTIGGMTLIGHAGGAVGYSTVMYHAPDLDVTIVASDNVIDLGTAYLDLMMPALRELSR